MALMDVLNGMMNGPRGQPAPTSGSSGGMSPITMAVLGLLAYKAVKSFSGGQPNANAGATAPVPGGANAGTTGGGLGDMMKGGLGGLLAGGAAGSVLSGGLGDLLQQFQQKGLGDHANSWIGNGPNKSVSPNDLGKTLGQDQIGALMAQTGLSRDDLLAGLSRYLPDVVNELTPQGRLPTDQELSQRM